MSRYNDNPSREKERREKLKTTLIICVFILAFAVILLLIFVGVSSPGGLESFFSSVWESFKDFLKEVRFKLDVYFRFFKSIFER